MYKGNPLKEQYQNKKNNQKYIPRKMMHGVKELSLDSEIDI